MVRYSTGYRQNTNSTPVDMTRTTGSCRLRWFPVGYFDFLRVWPTGKNVYWRFWLLRQTLILIRQWRFVHWTRWRNNFPQFPGTSKDSLGPSATSRIVGTYIRNREDRTKHIWVRTDGYTTESTNLDKHKYLKQKINPRWPNITLVRQKVMSFARRNTPRNTRKFITDISFQRRRNPKTLLLNQPIDNTIPLPKSLGESNISHAQVIFLQVPEAEPSQNIPFLVLEVSRNYSTNTSRNFANPMCTNKKLNRRRRTYLSKCPMKNIPRSGNC